ncbi:MAG: tRNA (guanosine(37)-N1)-methyltransferase TrmD [Clostridia bacterium]|nr:tRNA (guanosine(37)-N1)-methyltransferase TrmD [Clostridia bacterium]
MRIDILTLFPDMCRAVFSESILGRAVEKGAITVNAVNIRDYTLDKHNRVDDSPYGGGMGMLMQAQPIFDCYRAIEAEAETRPFVVYLSPQGEVLTQKKAKTLSEKAHLVLLCGHYEGVDERVLEEIVDEEISIGDYVLTGGELPALVLTDCIARMLPGVLPNEEAYSEESHFSGLLEYPQYTKPAVWNDREVPEVLLSGHHANIDKWRREQSILRTARRRPDLLEKAELTEKEREWLRQTLEKCGHGADGADK